MRLARLAAAGLAAALLALGACGGDDAADRARAQQVAAEQAAATEAQRAVDARAARREAAAARRAARKRREAAERRAALRARDQGNALLAVFDGMGTRDQWSIMGVSVRGGAVTVHTDLPPDRADGFNGACAALIDRESWIRSVAVTGTDGASHASWSKGDPACTAAGGPAPE